LAGEVTCLQSYVCHSSFADCVPARSDVSPDGDTQEEVALALALDHPHLTRVRAVVVPPPAADSSPSSPSSSPHHLPGALVMDLVPGKPMAAKPTSQHLLRCK
jgi:hypothetical protein